MDRFAKFVETKLKLRLMGSFLLPATSVHFRSAGHVMNMKDERGIKPAPSAKRDTNATKVGVFDPSMHDNCHLLKCMSSIITMSSLILIFSHFIILCEIPVC